MENCERARLALSLGDECPASEEAFLKGHLVLCETCRLARVEIQAILSAAHETASAPGENIVRDLRERILSKLPAKTPSPWWIFQPGWAMAFALILAFGVFWQRGMKFSERVPALQSFQNLAIAENLDLLSEMEILENLEALEKI